MTNLNTSTLVLGEAPESDEETEENNVRPVLVNECLQLKNSVAGSAVMGEALESDEEVEVHTTYSNSAIPVGEAEPRREKFSDTSTIHIAALKKLREKNRLLYDGLTSFKSQILSSTNFELSSINQQLLKSQIELQQALNSTRQVKNNLNEFQKKLNDIVLADYIPRINVKVPKNII